MTDPDSTAVTAIRGARVILGDDIVEADVAIADGRIAEIGTPPPADTEIDARGLILAPALVDVHGDAFERQVMPRPGVFFPLDTAVLETDRQLAANGIATAYHAVTLSWEPGLRAVDRGAELLRTMRDLAPRLTVENRVQLRWETFAFEAEALIAEALTGPLLPSVAFNDHTSMGMRAFGLAVQDRAFEHAPDFAAAAPTDPRMLQRHAGNARRAGLSPEDYIVLQARIWERRGDVPAAIARIAAAGRAARAPMLSHDDTRAETRSFYRAHGSRVSEFPMGMAAAGAAREAGDFIVFGAPNAVRGGSHIGSLAAADMVEEGYCDALASDYYYPAMLAAVARLDAERRAPRAALWALVSKGPAASMGLSDRGEIAPGKRADLVLIDWPDAATPAIRATYSAGRTAYTARPLASLA